MGTYFNDLSDAEKARFESLSQATGTRVGRMALVGDRRWLCAFCLPACSDELRGGQTRLLQSLETRAGALQVGLPD